MKKRSIRLLAVVTLLVATLSLTALGVSLLHRSGRQPQEGTGKHKTLREIAQERDVDYTVNSEMEVEFGDPLSIVKYADAIVVGRIVKAESGFTKSGENILTSYSIDVERVVKDRTSETNTFLTLGQERAAPLIPSITVVREGGIVNVNGRRVSARVSGYDLLAEGKRYVFFLGWSPDLKGYRIVGGISGVVLVNEDWRLTPLGSDEKLKLRYEGTDLETFVRSVLER